MIGVTASVTVSRARSTMGLSDLPRTIKAKDAPKSRTKVKRWSQAFAEASLRADPPRNLTESLLAGATGDGLPSLGPRAYPINLGN